jgi:hypothetical protein
MYGLERFLFFIMSYKISTLFYRIQYREEQIQRKIEERKFLQEEKDLEEREKEYRLEMLREKVNLSKIFYIVECFFL